jgi:hypothetical protein
MRLVLGEQLEVEKTVRKRPSIGSGRNGEDNGVGTRRCQKSEPDTKVDVVSRQLNQLIGIIDDFFLGHTLRRQIGVLPRAQIRDVGLCVARPLFSIRC